jgi:hypothetical protein
MFLTGVLSGTVRFDGKIPALRRIECVDFAVFALVEPSGEITGSSRSFSEHRELRRRLLPGVCAADASFCRENSISLHLLEDATGDHEEQKDEEEEQFTGAISSSRPLTLAQDRRRSHA